MTHRGPYPNRVPRRRRAYTGPARSATAWSSGGFIAMVLAILVVALAIAYGVHS
ncbi:MAG TPA: hypothetical protein VH678_12360 [Xanthobacteraceae bacterium]|jgi:hypothetical protein